jgi:hypothetical protein
LTRQIFDLLNDSFRASSAFIDLFYLSMHDDFRLMSAPMISANVLWLIKLDLEAKLSLNYDWFDDWVDCKGVRPCSHGQLDWTHSLPVGL